MFFSVVFRHLPWTGLEKERAKLNDGTVKEDVRKFLFEECESYLFQNKPEISGYKESKKGRERQGSRGEEKEGRGWQRRKK